MSQAVKCHSGDIAHMAESALRQLLPSAYVSSIALGTKIHTQVSFRFEWEADELVDSRGTMVVEDVLAELKRHIPSEGE